MFTWTNTGSNIVTTDDKNVNFVFKDCKFINEVDYDITGSAHRFMNLDHLGTTVFENCYFEVNGDSGNKPFDLTNTSRFGTSKVTFNNPTFVNMDVTLRAQDEINAEVKTVNGIAPDATGNVTIATGGGSGTVDSVVAGTNITVDATDAANPIVNGASTDLVWNSSARRMEISTGQNATINLAGSVSDGLMSVAQNDKLAAIEDNATANPNAFDKSIDETLTNNVVDLLSFIEI